MLPPLPAPPSEPKKELYNPEDSDSDDEVYIGPPRPAQPVLINPETLRKEDLNNEIDQLFASVKQELWKR